MAFTRTDITTINRLIDAKLRTFTGGGGLTAPVDATDIGAGSVTDTEFGYLDGVTSAIQTQIDGKAASSHSHAASDITSGTMAAARLGSGTTDATTYLTGNQTFVRQYTVVPLHCDATGRVNLTNQANATQFIANTDSNIMLLDLSRFTQVRMTIRIVLGSASANTPKVRLRYSTSYTTTASSYSDIGTSEVGASLATATFIDTGWIDLASSAKAAVYVALIQTGGDGAADPC